MTIDTEPNQVETVTPNTTPNTKVVKAKAFTLEFVQALGNYLVTRPYAEVTNLMEVIKNSPEMEVTVTQNATESK